MVAMTERQYEHRRNAECDIIGVFLAAKSIEEGTKRDLHAYDFGWRDTREAYLNMTTGKFDTEKHEEMIICRGADSNVGIKINWLINLCDK